jgi:hypothetical protein
MLRVCWVVSGDLVLHAAGACSSPAAVAIGFLMLLDIMLSTLMHRQMARCIPDTYSSNSLVYSGYISGDNHQTTWIASEVSDAPGGEGGWLLVHPK